MMGASPAAVSSLTPSVVSEQLAGPLEARFAVHAVEVRQGFPDGVRCGANKFDLPVQDKREGVRGFHVHRIPDRHHQRAIAQGHGNSPVAPGNIGIQRLQHSRRRRDGAQVDELHAVLRGERSHHVLFADGPLLDQFPEHASRAGFGVRHFDLARAQQSNFPQYFEDVFFVVRHDDFRNYITIAEELRRVNGNFRVAGAAES